MSSQISTEIDKVDSPLSGLKPCPYCAELIQEAAIVCRYCKRDLVPTQGQTDLLIQAKPAAASAGTNWRNWVGLGGIAMFIGSAAAWATLSAGWESLTVYGYERDGIITGVGTIIYLLFAWRRSYLASAIIAVAILGIGVLDVGTVLGLTGAYYGVKVSLGIGMYLLVGGAILGIVASLKARTAANK